jgi:carbonic anhydrase/acetyltransferase-like protein (isoleucine patch superfamily)
MSIYSLRGTSPLVHRSAYLWDSAILIGDVEIGPHSSVWPGASIRGDEDKIRIGARCSLQEGAVIHADHNCPVTVGDDVTIGHQALLHGCRVGEGSLIGMQAVVMNGAVIGRHSLVGAGALVTERSVFPERSLILGSPAKVTRSLTDSEVAQLIENAQYYVRLADEYRLSLVRIG